MNDISIIVCEFNPLHFGHREIIMRAGENAHVVCIMSGNYTQRGEPAILSKWARAEAALKCGASLVVELPLPWACAGAESFARGGIYLAEAFGLKGELFFGSESGDIAGLTEVAGILLSEEFRCKLAEELAVSKRTFAKTREKVVTDMVGRKYGALLASPNNILGIEYIKAIMSLKSGIIPRTIKRIGAGHDRAAELGEIMSAGELREIIKTGGDISDKLPAESAEVYAHALKDGEAPVLIESLEKAILYKLRTMTAQDFAALPDISEGLESRLCAAARKAASLYELYSLCKTKRYTLARIRRLVLCAFLGVTAKLPENPPYVRILGMDKTGEEIIRKAEFKLPLLVKAKDYAAFGDSVREVFELEARADDVYALMMPKPQECGLDYTKKVVKYD